MSRSRVGAERGVALVLVLWLVVILGVVSAEVVGRTRAQSSLVLNVRARSVARRAAESGVVAAVARLEDRLATSPSPAARVALFHGPEQLFGDLREVPLGDARFTVSDENLSARIDLNRADPAELLALFSEFVGAGEAQAVTDRLQDWRDLDDLTRPRGAEKEAYRRARSPFVPANQPLRRVDELGRILGVSPALARAVAPYVTVDGDLSIDVNAAPETVLAAIPGIGSRGARAIISGRHDGPLASAGEVQALLRGGGPAGPAVPLPRVEVSPRRILIVSRGWLAGHPLTHEIRAGYAIVGPKLVLLSWRERDL
jgi:general secretion pathway protein K